MSLEVRLTASKVVSQFAPVEVPRTQILSSLDTNLKAAFTLFFEVRDLTEDIFWDQTSSYGIYVRTTLEQLAELAPNRELFDTYLAAMQLGYGIHDPISKQKFFPDFSEADLKNVYDKAVEKGKKPILSKNALLEILFSPNFEPHRPKETNVYDKSVPEGVRIAHTDGYSKLRRHDSVWEEESFWDIYKDKLSEAADKLEKAAGYVRAYVQTQFPTRDGKGKSQEERSMFLHLAHYLETYAGELRTRQGEFPFRATDIIRAESNARFLPFFGVYFEFGSKYADEYKQRYGWTSEIEIQTPECERYNRLFADREALSALEKQLPYAPAIREDAQLSAFVVMDIIGKGGDAGKGRVKLGTTWNSEDVWVNDTFGQPITIMRNSCAAKLENIVKPLAETFIPEEVQKLYAGKVEQLLEYDFVVRAIAGHEGGHERGKKAEQKEREKAFGDSFSLLGELTGDIGGIYFADRLMEMLAAQDQRITAEEATNFCYDFMPIMMLRQLRSGINEQGEYTNDYSKDCRMLLSYFKEKGVIEITDDLKFVVHKEKVKEAAGELYAQLLEMHMKADRAIAEKIVCSYLTNKDEELDGKIRAIVTKSNRLNIPLDIRFVYN